jgi:hypothetical protein
MKVPERKVIGNLRRLVYIYKNGVENPFISKIERSTLPKLRLSRGDLTLEDA